jgi:hypothetical protein
MSKFTKKMEEAIATLVADEGETSDYICANWVLVTEWADYGGNRYLHTEVSEEMTPWNAYGMMKMAEEYNSDVLRTKNIGTEDDYDEEL